MSHVTRLQASRHTPTASRYIILQHAATHCNTLQHNAIGLRAARYTSTAPILQCTAMCSSALQCVTVCCGAVQCIAMWRSELQCVQNGAMWCSVVQCVQVHCSVLQCVAACCSVLQCVAVCCSVLQCITCEYMDTCNIFAGDT